MKPLPFPRNFRCLQGRERGSDVVVSFVEQTRYRGIPHVYVDSGRDYDMRPLRDLRPIVAVRRGIDCARVCRALLEQMGWAYPAWVDVDERHVAYVVDGPRPLGFKLWNVKQGSSIWRTFFA